MAGVTDEDLLEEVGWLRALMQEDADTRATVMRVVHNNGFDDLGKFADAHREAFMMLTEGFRDLVAQDLTPQ
jgi:hypothetical protein